MNGAVRRSMFASDCSAPEPMFPCWLVEAIDCVQSVENSVTYRSTPLLMTTNDVDHFDAVHR